MANGLLQETTDNNALRELRDSVKLLTVETIKSSNETAKLSKVILILTIISTLLAFSQLKSLIDMAKWLLSVS